MTNVSFADAISRDKEDEKLPPHLRRSGRMQSLHEFQRRVESIRSTTDSEPEEIQIRTDDNDILEAEARTDYSDFLESVRRNSVASNSKSRLIKHFTTIIFLVLLGAIAGPLNLALKSLCGYILEMKWELIDKLEPFPDGYLVWTIYTCVLVLAACTWTKINPSAQGSGLPQMKTVLTGVDPDFYVPGFFTKSAFIARFGGLVLAVGSGLIVGTEGSFVHIISIIGNQLLKLKIFEQLGNRRSRMQLLAACCAVGVSSTFNAPIGGVLFSIEVTSTYYLISNYLKAFISSSTAALAVLLSQALLRGGLHTNELAPFETEFPSSPYAPWEVGMFAILGILCGLIGGIIVRLVRQVALIRRHKFAIPWVSKLIHIIDPLVIAGITAAITWFPGEITRRPITEVVQDLFALENLPTRWANYPILLSVLIFAAVPLIMLPLSITLRVPTGAWLPMFAAGAGIGRLFGEAIRIWIPHANVYAGGYALVGAASMAAAVTRTVSAAVIVLEVTGQLRYLTPVLCGVLLAIGSSALLSKSIYETLLITRKLPYLPLLDFMNIKTVKDIMDRHMVYVAKKTTVVKLLLAVNRLPGHDIPVVYTSESGLLLGTLHADQIKLFIRAFYYQHDIPGVNEDLGEAGTTMGGNSSTWMSFKTIFSSTKTSNLRSFDLLHNKGKSEERLSMINDESAMEHLIMLNWSEKKKRALTKDVNLSNCAACKIKPMPMTISSATSPEDVHVIFTMLRCDHCYVTDHGRLTGVVTTRGMLDAGYKLE